MKVLLDTNIVIHREASTIIRQEIGSLFGWIDRLHYEKCIHPLSIEEIRKHQDPSTVKSFEAKIKNYHELKTQAPEVPEISEIRKKYDDTDNDYIDTSILKEVYCDRVDLLITEDRNIHLKALILGIPEKVFTIDAFLEKVTAENPELADYNVLSVKKEYFGNVSFSDSFFDSFRDDYPGFEKWFNRKAEETAYICTSGTGDLLAFLYVKLEREDEEYSDINPKFEPKRRLKIGTLKVVSNGYKLGERFFKIAFDNALLLNVEEIYVTIFNKTQDHERLILLFQDWGFKHHGIKYSSGGEEQVYVRDFTPVADCRNPCVTYPYISRNTRKFIVPIYPKYHTELFPDSILKTESPFDFVESKPNRNAISKVYISRSIERDLKAGDIIVFYRTKTDKPAYYSSVATTIGVVQQVFTDISSLKQFIDRCRKRSVFTNSELAEHWNYNRRNRPFVVNFVYVYSFPKRPNLKQLMELEIIAEAPRGFEPIGDNEFQRLLEAADADQRFIVD